MSPSVSAKPLHVADREDEEHDRGEQVDPFGGVDRAQRALPAGLDGADEAAAVAQLVAYSFEVDDERVGREADRDDQTRDAGERQPVALAPGQDRDHQVGDDRGDDERRDRHEGEQPVLEERVDDDQDQADQPGDEAAHAAGCSRASPRWCRWSAPRS